nr:retrovirus-related Pol polyprotein from transposon TNT 1-94 [Tanacetum cinerariifolium]
MTRQYSQLINFVRKFIGTVRFANDHVAAIMGYMDSQIGNVTISQVYYVEGLGHNLFLMGQFCDFDLEVAFRKHTYFVCDLKGVDVLKGSRGTNLYTISLEEMMRSSLICLLSKASKTKSWLWHRRLSHLNFKTINELAKQGLVRGLPKLQYQKDHLCSACSLGKSKKHTHKPKAEDSIQEKLYLLHVDLCGPMRIESINGKKYILVIVDDYSRCTWVKFLRSKDETLEFVIKFMKQIQVWLNATVRNIRTNYGTEFVNQTLKAYYEDVRILYQTSVARTPKQNDIVERRNRNLMEASRTMLIFSKAPLFLWAKAVATTCFTQNQSLICKCHNKTPYELLHDKKTDLTYLHVFGALCYPTNDSDDLGKEHGRMIYDSVLNDPLVWSTIEVDGVTRPKTYEELYEKEKLQADCELITTKNVLQGLPLDVYSLVNHHIVYNEFDRFATIKDETLYEYYLCLQLKWSRFVTDVKLARDLHTTNYDQLYAYLRQHEAHANEVRMMRKRYPDPLALIANYHQSSHTVLPEYASFLVQSSSISTTAFTNWVTIQQVQGRQNQSFAGMGTKGNVTSHGGNNTAGKDAACLGIGIWSAFETDDLDAYDLECDDISSAKLVVMANISSYDSDVISEIEAENNEGIMDEDVSSDDDRDHTNSSMITKLKLKIGNEFLKILHDNSFNGMDESDVTDHIVKVLEITEWIKIPNVDKDELRLHVFSKSLSGDNHLVEMPRDSGTMKEQLPLGRNCAINSSINITHSPIHTNVNFQMT